MININLKPGAKRAAPKGEAFAGMRERLVGLRTLIKEPGLVLAGGTWLVVALVMGGLYLHTHSRLNTLEPAMDKAQREYRLYHSFVTEKKREGRARDSILAQIGTISSVDQDRYTWSHILDEVSSALPEATWLTTIAPAVAATTNQPSEIDSTAAPTVTVVIAGQTNDLQNYTTFLRRLGESHWLINVLPVKTETIIDHNRPVTSFTVQATFARADSSRMLTVPILESTVR